MSVLAIRIGNLSKHYRIGEREPYKMLREVLTRWVSTQFCSTASRFIPRPAYGDRQPDHFWALRDISFEVRQGEVLGIIGNNGAGKSTLLKILSRISRPTSGRAEVHGRLGSLLE